MRTSPLRFIYYDTLNTDTANFSVFIYAKASLHQGAGYINDAEKKLTMRLYPNIDTQRHFIDVCIWSWADSVPDRLFRSVRYKRI